MLIQYRTTDNSLIFYYGETAFEIIAISDNDITTGVRLGIVADGTTMSIWINGVKHINTITKSTFTDIGKIDNITFGRGQSGGGQINGHIKNVRIYDRSLSDYEAAIS